MLHLFFLVPLTEFYYLKQRFECNCGVEWTSVQAPLNRIFSSSFVYTSAYIIYIITEKETFRSASAGKYVISMITAGSLPVCRLPFGMNRPETGRQGFY
jgi:hypothetical protein